MSPTTKGSSSESVKVLTESEIQQRLYGKYLGRRDEKSAPPKPISPTPVTMAKAVSWEEEPEWTGAEILAGELERLRGELISLRRERESLEQQLTQRVQVSPPVHRKSGAWRFVGKVLGVIVLLAAIAYPVGMRILTASPPGIEDPSPYTVQVAVYDVKPMAEKSLAYLQELGYQAFLMDIPRQNGNPRYRVYVGRFVTKEEATLERARLAADPRFTDSFVRFQ